MKTLSRDEARSVYDRIGARQDSQAFYEDPAIDALIRHGRFESAHRVFELGGGTGRLAERLLSAHLPRDATWRLLDLSPRMVGIAADRLARFGPRVRVCPSDGAPPSREPAGCCDRFVSTYVLDLLSGDDIEGVLREAHRMLEPDGLLCLTSLSTGCAPLSRAVARLWSSVHRWSPTLVGGCRPLELTRWLPEADWRIVHHEPVAPFGVPSEVVVAERRGAARASPAGAAGTVPA